MTLRTPLGLLIPLSTLVFVSAGQVQAQTKTAKPAPKPARKTMAALPAKATVPQTIKSPLGKTMTLKFHDEFEAVKDKDGQPYIDSSK